MSQNNQNLCLKATEACAVKDYPTAVFLLYRWFFATALPKADQMALSKKIEFLKTTGHSFKLVGVYTKKRRLLRTDLVIQFPHHRVDYILGGRVSDPLIELFANQAGVKMVQSDAKDEEEEAA